MKQIKNNFLNNAKAQVIGMVKLLGFISVPVCFGFMMYAPDVEKDILEKCNIELNEGAILGTQDISGIFSSKKVIIIDSNNNENLDKNDMVLTLKLNNDTNKKIASLAKTGNKILTLDINHKLIYVTAIQNSNQKYNIIKTPNEILPHTNVNNEKINTLFEKTVNQR